MFLQKLTSNFSMNGTAEILDPTIEYHWRLGVDGTVGSEIKGGGWCELAVLLVIPVGSFLFDCSNTTACRLLFFPCNAKIVIFALLFFTNLTLLSIDIAVSLSLFLSLFFLNTIQHQS